MMGLACGYSLVGPIFWLITPWELTLLLYSVIPMVTALLLLVFVIVDTPFEAVTKGTPDRALKQLNQIAAVNGIESDLTEEEVARIKDEYDRNEQGKR